MLSLRQLFLQHVGQTSDFPLQLEIEKAEGIYMYDTDGKSYMDIISGISVSNIGHRHPKVIEAIKEQLDKYMHLMCYGEYVQAPQVKLAKLLADNLPSNLDSTYFVNSGSEAIEGALKLAKRYTGRTEIVSFKNAYHGSTHGALSVGEESLKNAYRPMLPGIKRLEYNNISQLQQITFKTACVIAETVQGEAGVVIPENDFLLKLRQRCDETGALLILDEVQTGFGRTGTLFAFEQFGIVPDIMTIAKGMGGGMPIGAFVSSKEIMDVFKNKPILGHITTFGGHPVSCAAAYATLKVLLEENIIEGVKEKEALFKKHLVHPSIKGIRSKGLIMAVQLESTEQVLSMIKHAIELGVVSDWFLFCDDSFRVAPPLIITEEEIKIACDLLLKAIDKTCQ